MSKPNLQAELHERVDEFVDHCSKIIKRDLHKQIDKPVKRDQTFRDFIDFITN